MGLPGERRRRARRRSRCCADVAEARDPELVKTLDERFDALNALLATHGSLEAGFKYYDELSQAEVQALAAAVDALSEPLSKLTSTITGAG